MAYGEAILKYSYSMQLENVLKVLYIYKSASPIGGAHIIPIS